MSENFCFKYYTGVTDNSKMSVRNTVNNFRNQIKQNEDFLKGFTFHVVTDYTNLDGNSELTKFVKENNIFYTAGGMTVPAVYNKDKKEIIINVNNTGPSCIWQKNKTDSEISQAIMHEIGHQFDDFFGSCDEDLLERVKQLPFTTTTKEEEEIMMQHSLTKDLSDTPEFKTEWKKDIENYSKLSFIDKIFNGIPFEYTPYEIDITDGISDEEVEKSDNARSEIFAQLFSYAIGEDDGEKKDITNIYKNSYNLIKTYISNFLGIECP